MKPEWAVHALVGSLLCAAGCSNSCNEDKANTREEADAGESAVEMVSEGRAPRAVLQVARWKGLSYRIQVEHDASIGVAGQLPLRGPILITTLRVQVTRGAADPLVRKVHGRTRRLIEERAVLEKVEVKPGQLAPEALEQANQGLRKFAGTTTRQLVGEDGELLEMTTELVGGAPPEPDVKAMLDAAWESQRRFPFRLPPGPVGVGARWRFAEPIELNGVRAMQVADVRVVDMDAARVRLKIRLRHQAPRQEMPHPLDPKDTAMLERYRGDGDGELVMDRMSAVLLEARLSTTASLQVSAYLDGDKTVGSFVAATRFVSQGTLLADDAGATPAAAGDAADAEPAP